MDNSSMLETGAVFSPCERYRYALWRIWDRGKPVCSMIGLNPSRADARVNDPTIRRCINWAYRNNFGSLYIGNLFAWRAVKPRELYVCDAPVGPDNDEILLMLHELSDLTLFFWGNHGQHLERNRAIRQIITNGFCLRRNKTGEPAHILYLPANLKAVPYRYDQD